jgi:hypothetical protein
MEQSCIASGLLGIGMLCAAFSTMTVSEHITHKKYTEKYRDVFQKIVTERRNLYFQGIILGLIISYFLLKVYKTTNSFHRICFVAAVTLMIAVVYYFLMPKSDYMLNHLKTPEENKEWLHTYKYMKQRYFIGFLLGTLASIPIAYSMCIGL